MSKLKHSYSEEELKPYEKYGEIVDKTSNDELVLFKWLEEFIDENNLRENKEFIGILGSMLFFLYKIGLIVDYDTTKKELSKFMEYYNQNINLIQREYPFKLQSTFKHLLLMKKYENEELVKNIE
ncbi:MAG: hypothetical protein ACOCVF_02025 [bacterium]